MNYIWNTIIILSMIFGILLIILGFWKLFRKEYKKQQTNDDVDLGKAIKLPEAISYILLGLIFLVGPTIGNNYITPTNNREITVFQEKYKKLDEQIIKLENDFDEILTEVKILQNKINYSYVPYLEETFDKVKKNDIIFHPKHQICKIELLQIIKNTNKINIVFSAPNFTDPNVWLNLSGKPYCYDNPANDYRYQVSLNNISKDGQFVSIHLMIEQKITK